MISNGEVEFSPDDSKLLVTGNQHDSIYEFYCDGIDGMEDACLYELKRRMKLLPK